MNTNRLCYFIFLHFFVLANPAYAQHSIGMTRYEDDFTAVRADSLRQGAEKLKYIPIGKKSYLSLGGELREQLLYYNNINFGDIPPDYKTPEVVQLWQRAMLHTNIELGSHLRIFTQLNSTFRFFNDNPVVPEIDENKLNIHQAFVELKLNNWNFMLGEQEMYYGNHRLITFREGPNTRLSFEGIVIKHRSTKNKIDFFAVSKVYSKSGFFDDESMHDGMFGVYGTTFLANKSIGFDCYLVHLQSNNRLYNYQKGFEKRQTYGVRLFSRSNFLNYELEMAYQGGKFKNLQIDAYSILADINLTFLPRNKGTFGFATNIASGDRDISDNKLNTYNLLYAKPAYGLAVPIGATNIVSFCPYLKINPLQKFNVLAEIFFLSRANKQDGTYSAAMVQNRPAPNLLLASDKKTLGQLYVLETAYQPTKRILLSLDSSYFKAGNYPKDTGKGNNIFYLSLKSAYKF